MSKTDSVNQGGTEDWQQIPWRQLEKRVFKLQKRIYQASQRGDVRTVHQLQKTLVTSWSAKCLAVRKVTQENQGKKTAGVDGVKALNPAQRLDLVKSLKLGSKAKLARRVWIPKPGKAEQRPLSIPTMYDRALQALTKLALEPQWEAIFEPNSYGFRPGRSGHDAIEAIKSSVSKRAKYVLDADIQKCFDRINHEKLLSKVNAFPKLRRQLRAWLKAGVLDNGELFPTEQGTPQGGVISPLLANIALHGLEEQLKKYAETVSHKTWVSTRSYWQEASKVHKRQSLGFVRYADDFVVLHPQLDVILECKTLIEDWLRDLGLELKPSKTRVIHTLYQHQGKQAGFNFLGFNIRHYQVGKHNSARVSGKKLGYKLRVKPSNDSIKQHLAEVRKVVESQRHTPQGSLMGKLNPLIKGWTRYYATVSRADTMRKLEHLITVKLLAWANRRHHAKGQQWTVRKYWRTVAGRKWTFADSNGYLQHYYDQKHIKHAKVKGNKSPYDGDMIYWSQRMGKHPMLPGSVARLVQKQQGKCPECGLFLRTDDRWEIDHQVPKHRGGSSTFSNLQLLHKHCHHRKTLRDFSGGTHDKGQETEEPDEGKLSRPVLKPSGSGDRLA